MNTDSTQAILVVSFGTSCEHTRKVTIGAIERDIMENYPDHRIFRAWTSRMLLEKLRKRDRAHIDSVSEAMARMAAEGVADVTIQPTFVTDSAENRLLREDALHFRDSFRRIRFGAPLLSGKDDLGAAADAVCAEFSSLKESEALVLIGHGTALGDNTVYADLNEEFRSRGLFNIHIGTLKEHPDMEDIAAKVNAQRPKKVILSPFLIVAGRHAQRDIAGDAPGSWAFRFSSEGYEVEPVMKGLGEYEAIRKLFVRHVAEALGGSEKDIEDSNDKPNQGAETDDGV